MTQTLGGAVSETRADASAGAVARALAHVRALATGDPLDPDLRVTLNFHPDRLVGGRPILRAMALDGVYRSQFETGTSNGGLTAHPGGDRWRWEQRIFGGAYDTAAPGLRPKYGALNHRHRPCGGAPRFGSAHLRLAPQTLDRTTFCFPDSVFEPSHFGTRDRCDLIDLADLAGGDLLDHERLDHERPDADRLDDYVEAQVHGVVDLATDVEAIVLDPRFRGTSVEQEAHDLGGDAVRVEWHPGHRIEVSELRRHPGYRGRETVLLGARLAVDDVLTAKEIGDAARAGDHHPQDLKRLWHLVVRFGGEAAWLPAEG